MLGRAGSKVTHPSELQPGDHVRFRSILPLMRHHGIVVAHGTRDGEPTAVVVHNDIGRGVEKVSLDAGQLEVLRTRQVEHPGDGLPPGQVVERALERVGERAYSVLRNNCEHFANEVASGRRRSPQLQRVVASAATVPFLAVCGASSPGPDVYEPAGSDVRPDAQVSLVNAPRDRLTSGFTLGDGDTRKRVTVDLPGAVRSS